MTVYVLRFAALAIIVFFPISILVKAYRQRKIGTRIKWKKNIYRSFRIPMILLGIGVFLLAIQFALIAIFGRSTKDLDDSKVNQESALDFDDAVARLLFENIYGSSRR
jgi:hypothetical protein